MHFELHIMFAKKFRQMNQCIVNVIGKSIFVTFNKIVKNGSIEIWSMGNNIGLLEQKEIENTNFTNFNVKDQKGKLKLEIISDNEKISRIINVK